jgi:hypothetical protein
MEDRFAMTWERTAEASSAAAPDRLWAVLLDGRRWSEWNPGVQWMTLEGPLAAGSVLTLKPAGAPQTASRIEAVVPERLLALAVRFGPVASLRLRWEIEPRDGGARIVQTVAIAGPLAGMLLRNAALRIASGMHANLVRLTERAATAENRSGA